MLGISINNEFLDLLPGTQLELEQENPFLQFSDEVKGDFSLPFELPITDRNLRLTGYAGLIHTRVDSAGIDAALFDNGLQVAVGKLKFEKPAHNLNRAKDGSVSCYFLGGVASFFQDVKDIKLRSVNVGGVRTFPWTNYNRTGSNGFWQHIHAVIDAPAASYDYAFFPVKNVAWDGEWANTDVMNYMQYSGGNAIFSEETTDGNYANVIVPFPYLKYVLLKVGEHIGWQIEGAILEDPDFQKITMLNFKNIDWGYMRRQDRILGTQPTTYPNVVFNLQNHLPDITVSQFMIWLKNRFGWSYDTDRVSKILRIKALTVTAASDVKDYSKYASPVVIKKINQQKKGYALINEFSGGLSGAPLDLKASYYQGAINLITDMPAPVEAKYAHSYLVRSENRYYICFQDVAEAWTWQVFGDNNSDVIPADTEYEEIKTGATTVGSERYDNYLDLIPRLDIAGEWTGQTSVESSWNVHLLFYQGKQPNKLGQLYPFGTNGIYNSAGGVVGNWSLCYKAQKFDGTEIGLYDLNWKKFLEKLLSSEEPEATLYLPRLLFLSLKFSDVISINNVQMYVKKQKTIIPYGGSVQFEGVRT